MTNLDDFHSYLRSAGLDTKPHQIEGVKWCLSNELDGHAVCSDAELEGSEIQPLDSESAIHPSGWVNSEL